VNSPTICAGQTANLTASGATSYTWTAGATSTGTATADASPLSTTTYTVTGIAGTCTGTTVSTVTVNPLPIVTVNSPTICAGDVANLTAGGGTSYTWSLGATSTGTSTADASPLTSTSYTVTGATSGCSNTAVSTITVNPIPVVTVNSPTVCPGAAGTLTAAGATTYLWSTGSTANPISLSPAGTTSYTVSGTSAGCTGTAVATITVASVLAISVNSPTICIGQTANLSASGGTSYTWTAGAISTGINTADASPSSTTSYTVTGMTGTCSGTAVSTVTVNPFPTITVNSPTICAGDTANLIASGGTSYTWSIGASSTGINTADASPAANTSYTVTGTTAGCSTTAVSNVTVTPLPLVTVNSVSICPGATATLTAAGATTYSWSTGSSANPISVSPASTDSYTVTGTAAGCSATAVSTVTINTVLPADAGANDTICFGGSTNLNATPTGLSYSYSWLPASGLSSVAISNPTADPTSTTTYSVLVTDPNGCVTTDSVKIYSDPQIILSETVVDAACFGVCNGNITVNPVGGTPSYSYSWNTVPVQTTQTAIGLCVGSHTVTVTDLWGCAAQADTIVLEPTSITSTSSHVNATCFGGCNGTATITPAGGTPAPSGYSYSWSTSPVQTTQTATGLCAGTYTCTISDNNACSITTTVTITEPTAVDIASIANPTICYGASTTLTANVTGGTGAYTYSWTPSTGLSSTTVYNPTASLTTTQPYTLTVTDANFCQDIQLVTVNVNLPLTASPAGGAICKGASTIISANASGGSSSYTYSWSPSTGLNNATFANPTASPLTTTQYTVTVNDGCIPAFIAPAITVTVNPLPVPAFDPGLPGCAPHTVVFTDKSVISSGTINTLDWNFGDGGTGTGLSPSHDYDSAGVYPVTLTVTSTDNCSATSSPQNVTIYPVPDAAFTAPPVTSIFSPTVKYTDESVIGTGGNITSWHWNFGDTLALADSVSSIQNPSHLFSAVGTYCAHLVVKSTPGGCTDYADLCIIIEPEFTFFIPNAFSPNDDEINEEFFGVGENITKFDMLIYDRWGNLLFHSNDIKTHWNGKINNTGELLPEDVYVYVIKLVDFHGITHKYIGSVTIVK
jgi:gliding motility-associated-like protein